MENFEILQKLGDGAYSVVYKVRRKIDGNIYALKKVKLLNLKDKEKQNALNEVRILASVKSTFVISYKEAFIDESESSLCIVMEYADQGDLFQKITQFKKMGVLIEEVDIWRIFIQMTKGLKALHDLKILHRDMKSANIFLFSDGSAKIGDLNVSKVARKGLGYTQTGTPYYASPEVWKDQPYDSKSDIWSLGCITYEMLTLRPPFRAESMEGLYNKVIKGHYPKIGDRYSSDISEIIKMLLKVNSSDRPTCAQILKHPIIKKRLEFFKANENIEDIDSIDEGVLLQTIRIPKNVLFLADKLPGSNYNKKKNEKNLPDIKFTEGSTNENNNNNNNKMKSNPNLNNHHMKLNSVSKSVVQKENNNNINNNNYSSENTAESKKNESQEQSKIIKDQKIKIIKEEDGLPNLEKDKIDINPINSQRKVQLQKRAIQNKKELEYQKYLQNLGLGDIYKVNYLNLGNNNNNGNRINKQQRNRYGNYLPGIYKNKRNNGNSYSHNYNSSNSNNIINKSPRIIPNKRLNPINKGLGIKILY